MADDLTAGETPTRRDYVRYGGALVGGGLLAGCLGGTDPDSTSDETQSGAGDPSEETAGGPHSATLAPVGELDFDDVPQRVMVYSLLYADMAVAYGHGDAVNSLGFDAEAGGNTLDAYYDRLDGVSFDRSDLKQLNTGSDGITVDKELLYELNSDLHLADPCLITSFDGWGRADVDEIRDTVAPWFGNAYSREHGEPPEDCRDDYEYYTLWEIAEQVAAVFREQQRFEALAEIHEDLLARIRSALPPEADRPTVGAVIFMEEAFYPTKSTAPGFANAHIRPLDAPDAFADEEITYETSYDYEAMLEFDPDVIVHPFGVASYYDVGQIREALADHPVGSQLTAVRNDRVYASGNPVQGPIMNLFQLEMTAKQLYPERFGAWPGYENGDPYPAIPEAERLFDRERVAAVVSGE
ncbi:ABC transporter substrate-binding protein [Haloferacaceae archaeon DSL9]